MRPPPIDDVIVAVSTAWAPSALGVLRLSGPGCFELIAAITANSVDFDACELHWGDGLRAPARVFRFRAPHSYTGQDVVEIHTIGCLPLLRELCEMLIERGARRALPGEFTARAFLNRKLPGRNVERIADLIAAADRDAARTAARAQRESYEPLIAQLRSVLLNVLSAIEAGIDFVDEEDVRFISGGQVVELLSPLVARLDAIESGGGPRLRESKPHVALAGLPNAGKSTLFNRLCGTERAIVSPQIGTTRDVLSVELDWGGVSFVLQDCAGLGADSDELEIASYRAAERTADQAELVLWVHDCRAAWGDAERRAMTNVDEGRRLIVMSQIDRADPFAPTEAIDAGAATVRISAATGAGLRELRAAIIGRLAMRSAEATSAAPVEFGLIRGALRRAVELVERDPRLASGELVALEIRSACELLDQIERGPLVEDVLGRIFSTFCIGK